VFWLTFGIAGVLYDGPGPVRRAAGGAGWRLDILAEILPVLALRIPFDALATVPGALVARRMQFRYTALRGLLANAVAAALCVWLVLEGFALWALVLSQIANGFVAMVVSVIAARWRPGRDVSKAALTRTAVLRPLCDGRAYPEPGAARPGASGRRHGRPDAGALLFRQRLFTMLGDLTSGVFGPVTSRLMASLQAETSKTARGVPTGQFRLRRAGLSRLRRADRGCAGRGAGRLRGAMDRRVYALQCFCVMGMIVGSGSCRRRWFAISGARTGGSGTRRCPGAPARGDRPTAPWASTRS
jgi:teichuronic acid exporter